MKRFVWVFLIACACPAWGQEPEISVVSGALSQTAVPSRLFGQNLTYFREQGRTPAKDLWAWDVTQSSPSWAARTGVASILGPAVGEGSLIRFPHGVHSDAYHWRRGVGWPLMQYGVAGIRPRDPNPYDSSGNTPYGNEFGVLAR